MRDRKDDRATIIALVKQECEFRQLETQLICSIIELESSFDTFAMRYEPEAMRVFAVEESAKINGIAEVTERVAQKFSLGLGQVLGSTLRWLGFRDLLTSQCDPATGIHWCCEAFEKLGHPYMALDEKIAAYNAGSVQRNPDGTFKNQKYVNTVLNYYKGKKYE